MTECGMTHESHVRVFCLSTCHSFLIFFLPHPFSPPGKSCLAFYFVSTNKQTKEKFKILMAKETAELFFPILKFNSIFNIQ